MEGEEKKIGKLLGFREARVEHENTREKKNVRGIEKWKNGKRRKKLPKRANGRGSIRIKNLHHGTACSMFHLLYLTRFRSSRRGTE